MPKKAPKQLPKSEAIDKKPTWRLSALLIVTSIIIICVRLFFLGSDTLAGGDSLWRLNIYASTVATPGKTTLKIHPPFDTPYIRTIERNLSYPGFKVHRSTGEQKYRRNVFISAIDKGTQEIYAEYLLHLSQTPFISNNQNTELTTQVRERLLLDDEKLQFKSYIVKTTIAKLLINEPSQDIIISNVYDYIKTFSIYSGKDALNVPEVLVRKKATIYDSAITMVSLSRASGIPARIVSGLILKDDIEPQPHYWVEIYQDNSWYSYDIHFGYKKSVPTNYLPLRRNDKEIVQIENGNKNKIAYDLEPEFNHPYLRKTQKEQPSSILDLTRLQLDVRYELALLLLLPLGALITALFRHFLGVHSYGVFTPTLLALAIVYANLTTTLIVFLVVSSLAIGGRSFFPATLTRIPRLSIIFTLIAVILTMSVSVLSYFNIDQGGKIILLPIIILTSLVDRFYNTIEDNGMKTAIIRMVWTIIIALLCLPIIQFETLGHLILQFPETHLITLALFLLISLYKGKHIISLPIFKLLAEPEITKKKAIG